MDLKEVDRLILAKLQEGRASPGYLASELPQKQPYINQRLKELCSASIVVRVHRGLYGLESLEGERVTPKRRIKQLDDQELKSASNLHRNLSNTTQKTNSSPPADTSTHKSAIESLVDGMVLVSTEEEKQNVIPIVDEMYSHLRTTDKETKRGFKRHLRRTDLQVPNDNFRQFWKYYLNGGEYLTQLPNVTIADENEDTFIYID